MLSLLRRSLRSSTCLPSASSCLLQSRGLRELKVTETDKEIVIETVPVNHPKPLPLLDADKIPNPPDDQGCHGVPAEGCHPFCRLPFVNEVKHTDVLILEQFMRSDGHIMDRSVTGLCRRQQNRMEKLIRMAAKAGLFPPEKDIYCGDKQDPKMPWTKLNCYYDEKTIDIQWRENEKKTYKKSFAK